MTVLEIQTALLRDLQKKGWKYFAFNTYALSTNSKSYEADMVAISKNMTCAEYEIKRTRADFFADFGKRNKHVMLKMGTLHCNYFYYVCEQDLIRADEVPAYAGLMYIAPDGYVTKVKNAPSLNKVKITEKHLITILASVMYKYLNQLSA